MMVLVAVAAAAAAAVVGQELEQVQVLEWVQLEQDLCFQLAVVELKITEFVVAAENWRKTWIQMGLEVTETQRASAAKDEVEQDL